MGRHHERGFTLIEIMITVAIIGVLGAIAIPMYMGQTSHARGVEATLQLQKLARNTNLYFMEHHAFPPQLAEVLPGGDGTSCATADHKFAPSPMWLSDPTWSALEFSIGERAQFSYHFQATSPTSAHAWAVADPTCSGVKVQYDLYLEGQADGSVQWKLVRPKG